MGVAAGRRGRTSPGPGAVRFPGRAAGLPAADGGRRRRAALAQADRRRARRAARGSAAPRRPRRPTRNRFLGFGKTVRWPEGRHSENGGRGPVVNGISSAPPRRVRDRWRAPVLPGKESPRAPLLSRGERRRSRRATPVGGENKILARLASCRGGDPRRAVDAQDLRRAWDLLL